MTISNTCFVRMADGGKKVNMTILVTILLSTCKQSQVERVEFSFGRKCKLGLGDIENVFHNTYKGSKTLYLDSTEGRVRRDTLKGAANEIDLFLPRGVYSGWCIVVSLLVLTSVRTSVRLDASVPKNFDFK